MTPAQDDNDYMSGEKLNRENIDILNDNDTINEKGDRYVGQDR